MYAILLTANIICAAINYDTPLWGMCLAVAGFIGGLWTAEVLNRRLAIEVSE